MSSGSLAHAVAAAVAVAGGLGVRRAEPRVLADGANVLVHLWPAPVVARVATTVALVRPGPAWQARDIELARFLHSRGVPVVTPCTDPPAGPHQHDGWVLAFWRYVPHDPDRVLRPAEVAEALAELHAALREFPGELPAAGPFDDLGRGFGLDWLGVLTDAELDLLRSDTQRLRAAMAELPAQALHGDAHPGNLMATPKGLLWNDFEDTWRGPLAWDLACLANTGRLDGRAAVAAYPGVPADGELDTCLRLRRLYGVCWRFTLARRFPALAAEARAHLDRWLATRSH
jgi:hypothetical protein